MSDFTIDRSDIPLWSGAKGGVRIVAASDLTARPTPQMDPVLSAAFTVDGANSVGLGASDSVSIAVKGGETASIQFLWKSRPDVAADLIGSLELAGELDDARPLLALQVGTNASLDAEGTFHYNVVTAGATLAAGVDASFAQVKPVDPQKPIGASVRELFAGLTLPSKIARPLARGERVRFEFSGYLNVGASASAGYDIKGTKSVDVSRLQLSEHYQLAVVGTLAVTAKLAGRYAVDVRPTDRAGWARVIVRRARSKAVQFAADVSVDAALDTTGLPRSGEEFLGALLGVQAKNWLNLVDSAVDEAGTLASPAALKAKLDQLSASFIEKWSGAAVDDLLGAKGPAVLARIEKVVASYRTLDDQAIALFDRFYDPAAQSVGALQGHLDTLKGLASWAQLAGEVDPILWNVLRQLTGGDPLGWALGQVPGTSTDSLAELKTRTDDALALVQSGAHQEIRSLIATAKEHFALDGFLTALGTIHSADDLKSLTSTSLAGFVSRLTGTAITNALTSQEAKAAFEIITTVKNAKDTFWKDFDAVLTDAAQQTLALQLHAAYSRTDERDALIDVDIRLLNDDGSPSTAGQRLMRDAGRGDFSNVLAQYHPDVVRLREGVLTHRVTRESTLRINVNGWHLDYAYESAHRVITDARQQIRSSPTGQLTVFTQIDMRAESDERRRRRHEERMQSNFLLRFIGETSRQLSDSAFDADDQTYLVDVITSSLASYDLTFTDESTTRDELDDDLKFAKELGLAAAGATAAALAPILTFQGGSFGRIETAYQVRFTAGGLAALFPSGPLGAARIAPAEIRQVLRRIIVGNYFGAGALADVGWLFCSDRVAALYDEQQQNFVEADSILGHAMADGEVRIASPIAGVPVPSRVANTRIVRQLLAPLLDVQRDLIAAFTDLQNIKGPVRLKDFERALSAFGSALNRFDERDHGSHTLFSVFDGLIQLRAGGAPVRSSALTLTTTRDGQPRTAMFALQAEDAGAPALA